MLPIISKDCILDDVICTDKGDLIIKMVDTFDKNGYLNDKEQYHKDVLEREKVFSTYIPFDGGAVGLPHGRSSGVDTAGLCVARLNGEVIWNEETGDKVGTVIMIAIGNQGENEKHLQILAQLSRLLMHEDFRDKLIKGTKDDAYIVLNDALEI